MLNYSAYKRWISAQRDKANLAAIHAENGVEEREKRMKEIDGDIKTKVVQSIEAARAAIGEGQTMTEDQRTLLRSSVWLSCLNPRGYTYEHIKARYFLPVSSREFFRIKQRFLCDIKERLSL